MQQPISKLKSKKALFKLEFLLIARTTQFIQPTFKGILTVNVTKVQRRDDKKQAITGANEQKMSRNIHHAKIIMRIKTL